MARNPVRIFLTPEMAAQMPKMEGVEIVIENPAPAIESAQATAFKATAVREMEIESYKPKFLTGYNGQFYRYIPTRNGRFRYWYYDEGDMDYPHYLPEYKLAQHPEDPDVPWLTLFLQRPATLKVVFEGVASPIPERPLIDEYLAKFGGPTAQYSNVLTYYANRPPRPLPHTVKSITLTFPNPIGTLTATRIERAGLKATATFDLSTRTGLKEQLFKHLSTEGTFSAEVELEYKAFLPFDVKALGVWYGNPKLTDEAEDIAAHLSTDHTAEIWHNSRALILTVWHYRLVAPSKYGAWTKPGEIKEKNNEVTMNPAFGKVSKDSRLVPYPHMASIPIASILKDEAVAYQYLDGFKAAFDKPKTVKAKSAHAFPLDPVLHPKLFPDYRPAGTEERYAAIAIPLKNSTPFVYRLPSQPRNFYYLPDAFKLTNVLEELSAGFLVDLVPGKSTNADPRVLVELTAKPVPPAELLLEASRKLPKDYAVDRIDLHCLQPKELEFNLHLPSSDPDAPATKLTPLLAAQVMMNQSVTASFDCSLDVFRAKVFERLFMSGALVLTGNVKVMIERETKESVTIPVTFRFPEPPPGKKTEEWRAAIWDQIRPQATSAMYTRAVKFEAQKSWFQASQQPRLQKIVVSVPGGWHSLIFTADGPFEQTLMVSTGLPKDLQDTAKWFDFDYRAMWMYEERDPIPVEKRDTGDYVMLVRPKINK